RADVEMDEPKALGHARLPQLLGGEQDLGGVQAELRIVAGREPPLALAAGEELCAEANEWHHAHLLGNPDDVVDLRELLDDNDHLLVEFAAERGEADVVVVLVAVADDKAIATFVHRERDHQLGLRSRLEAVAKLAAGSDDLVNDLAQLVHLDGEHAAIAA